MSPTVSPSVLRWQSRVHQPQNIANKYFPLPEKSRGHVSAEPFPAPILFRTVQGVAHSPHDDHPFRLLEITRLECVEIDSTGNRVAGLVSAVPIRGFLLVNIATRLLSA